MQVVSNNFRPTLYSGGAQHHAILTIGNTTIDEENIKSIKLSNPIIDKTNGTFYIGTFVSKQIEIEFFNAEDLDLSGQIHLTIGTYIFNGYESTEDTTFDDEKTYYIYENNEYVEYDGDTSGNPTTLGLYEEDGDYEDLNIGYFNIETSPEDYYKNAKIVALDNAIKFKPNVDYSSAMDYKYYATSDTQYLAEKQYYALSNSTYTLLVAGTDYIVGDTISGTVYEKTAAKLISCEDLLIWLCNYFGVTLGTYPNVNKNIEISTYNSSVSGKQYISYIAEIMGGNAQIGRDGHLYIIPLKQTPAVQIDATESKSWELGEKYQISGVSYFDAIRTATVSSGSNTYNTLYIRSDNPFVVGDNDDIKDILDNIFDELEDTIIYNLKCENYADYSLDSWDFITYLVYKYFETTDTTYQANKSYYTMVSGEYELLVAETDYQVGDDIEDLVYERTQETYNTINDNEYTYEIIIMGKNEVSIPTKAVESTTNVVGDNERTKFNILKTTIDNANNRIDIIAGQTDEIQGQINTLSVQQDGLYNSYVRNGGTNLFYNTGLHFTDENGNFTYWNVEPTTSDDYLGVVNDSESLSGTNMVLPNGKISQTINTTMGEYCYSFYYKKNIPTANCYVTINGIRTKLGDETEWTENDTETQVLNVSGDSLTIEFECDVQGGYYIKELMLNRGTEPIEYSQNINETQTDTVQISNGILVSSSSTNTESRHDSDGFRILRKDNKEVVLRATENGTETTSIKASGDSEIAGLIIKKNNGHILLSGKGDD